MKVIIASIVLLAASQEVLASDGALGDSTIYLVTVLSVVGAGLFWWWKSRPVVPEKPVIVKPPIKSSVSSKNLKKKQEEDANFEYKQKCKVFFGSQTGTAEDFSHKLAKEAKRYKIKAEVVDLEEYERDELATEGFVILAVATYGEGEPTDNMREFYEWVMDPSRPSDLLKGLKFTIFGLGNKTYEHFNAMGRRLDKRLVELGAERIFKLGEGDDDSSLEDDFAAWKKELWPSLCQHFGIEGINEEEDQSGPRIKVNFLTEAPKNIHKYLAKSLARSDTTYDAKNPYVAKIHINKELHTPISDRSCRHIEVQIPKEITYEAGDHLGVYAENDPQLVEQLAKRLGVDLDAFVTVQNAGAAVNAKPIVGPCTVRQLLSQWCEISTPPRKSLIKVLAKFAKEPAEKEKLLELSDETKHQPYTKWVKDDWRCVVEILNEYKSVNIPLADFLDAVPRMTPRFYSISSSPKAHKGFVHITAVVVDFVTPAGRRHLGVATNYLSKLQPGAELAVFVRKSTFRLPKSVDTPIVMVGPGTGLAPFRGFIWERKHLSKEEQKGDNVLFFGCRTPGVDFIYEEELMGHDKEGHVKLHVAFSRHEGKKVYVQHKIAEVEDNLWNLIHEKRGHFYICGDARAMAKDVHNVVRNLVMKKLGKNEQDAEKYLKDLQDTGRYQTDVWQ